MSLKMIPGLGKSGTSRTAARSFSIESEPIAGTLAVGPETSTAARRMAVDGVRLGTSSHAMKRFAALFAVLAATALSLPAHAAEPAKSSSATPEDCLRNFYRWYVTALVANRDPMKQRTELKRFATDRLLKEIDKMKKGPDGLDGDYFVDAQDFDPLWPKNISISAVQTNGDRSNAHVLLNGTKGMRKKLIVHLAKEGGGWKVDKVQGRDGGD